MAPCIQVSFQQYSAIEARVPSLLEARQRTVAAREALMRPHMLRRLWPLAPLDDAALDQISGMLRMVTLSPRSVMFDVDASRPAESAFVLVDGSVSVVVGDGSRPLAVGDAVGVAGLADDVDSERSCEATSWACGLRLGYAE